MRLNQVMTREVQTCPVGAPLREAARIMADFNVGAVPVVSGERVVGILTDRDMVLRVIAPGHSIAQTTCGDCMSQPVTTATPDMDVDQAAELMASQQIRRLPVVQDDRLIGIVALGDLATVQNAADEAGQALAEISEPARPGAH